MKMCWLEIKRAPNGSRKDNPWTCLSMNLRNAQYISEIFGGMPVITDCESLKRYWRTDYDVILIGYSTTYTEYKLEVELLKANKHARRIYVTTDYECPYTASLFYSELPFEQIANTEQPGRYQRSNYKGWNNRTEFHFVNLNVLSFYKNSVPRIGGAGLIYYGQFRPDRAEYMKIIPQNTIISTKKKNVNKFFSVCPNGIRYIDSLSWVPLSESLRLFDQSLWLEDKMTHELYNCPPNRFYEALNCSVIPRPHISVSKTIERSGYKIPENWYWSNDQFNDIIFDDVAYGHLAMLREQASIERLAVASELKKILSP